MGPFDPSGPSTSNIYSIYILYYHREEQNSMPMKTQRIWEFIKNKIHMPRAGKWRSHLASQLAGPILVFPFTMLISLMVLPIIETYNLFTFECLRIISSAVMTSVTAKLKTSVSGLDYSTSSKYK